MSAKTDAVAHLLSTGALANFVGKQQRKLLIELINGEEGAAFVESVNALKATIDTMPGTYGSDSMGDGAVIHLHYFLGGLDAWVTEKDTGSPNDTRPGVQHQAFGRICIQPNYPELGYIGLQELIDNNVEIDLHWKPCTLAEQKARS